MGVGKMRKSFVYNGDKNITSFEIPDGVKFIGSNAFEGCNKLEFVKIPNGVLSISNHAFFNCRMLREACWQPLPW